MKPAISLLVFTVGSGSGLGLLAWLVTARLLGVLEQGALLWGSAIALGLFAVGLVSSSLHLANPRNAWRAFSGWRTSWLAREALAALAIWPVCAVWLGAALLGVSEVEKLAGLLLIALSGLTVWCTGMIYACLRTVPRWNSWHTRYSFPLFACVSGGVLWWAVLAVAAPERLGELDRWRSFLTLILAVAALLKYSHWKAFAGRRPQAIEAARAVGVSGTARLLDAGHTGPTFLTREFGFELDRARATGLRWGALVLAFALPALLIAWPERGGEAWLGVVAAGCCLAGLLVERWLFFAEAEHVVRLYHGSAAI